MTDRPLPTSDFCATCDAHLSEFCWVCHGRMEKERDDAWAEVERLRAEVAALRLAADEVLSWNLNDLTALLSNPPQNAALFHAQRVLRAARQKDGG